MTNFDEKLISLLNLNIRKTERLKDRKTERQKNRKTERQKDRKISLSNLNIIQPMKFLIENLYLMQKDRKTE